MTITFTAQPMEKPKDLSLVADMVWNYFQINCGGWAAVQTSTDEIILTDEGCSLTDGVCFIFCGTEDFLLWLEAEGEEHLLDDPEGFLEVSGLIDKRLLSFGVVHAVINAINTAAKIEEETPAPGQEEHGLPYDELLRLERSGYHTVEVEEKSTGKTGVARSVVRNCAAVEVCYGADDGSEDDVVSPDYFNRRFIITAAIAK